MITLREPKEKGKNKREKKKDIPRRPSTPGAPVETVEHVLCSCPEAKRIWGGHDGTLKGMVDYVKKIKTYFDEKRDKELRTKRGKRLQKQYVQKAEGGQPRHPV